MISRILIISGVALALATPASARQTSEPQQTTPTTVAATPAASSSAQRELKVQVTTFEGFLRTALNTAVQKFGQWVQQVAPNVLVTQATNPSVQGFPMPNGVMFTVQQAELLGSQVLVLNLNRTRPPATGAGAGTVVASGGVVQADPMVPGLPQPPTAPEGCAKARLNDDPNKKYGDCVEEELINAMLDNSVMLGLKPGQWLQVVDVPVDFAVRNPVYANQSRKLILSIKAEDLEAYHQGKIGPDEAKRRIKHDLF